MGWQETTQIDITWTGRNPDRQNMDRHNLDKDIIWTGCNLDRTQPGQDETLTDITWTRTDSVFKYLDTAAINSYKDLSLPTTN